MIVNYADRVGLIPVVAYSKNQMPLICNVKKHLPNLLTLANLLCGIFIILDCFEIYQNPGMSYDGVATLALLALGFDFLDGTAARLLKVESAVGKDLDSLADVVSFGVAPAFVLYTFWNGYLANGTHAPWVFVVFLIPVFAAYRLAIFNNTPQSKDYFLGLPTPGFALACFAIPLASFSSVHYEKLLTEPIFILVFVLLGCVLMLSKVKLLSLKLGSANKRMNILRMTLVLGALLFLIFFKFFGVILCLLWYLVISLSFQKSIAES